jgi:hypothetical protein
MTAGAPGDPAPAVPSRLGGRPTTRAARREEGARQVLRARADHARNVVLFGYRAFLTGAHQPGDPDRT